MSEQPVIGPRQTVDRAKHPTLGEGRAVYDNGDAWFIPDTGEPRRMNRISFGGFGTEKSSRGRYSVLSAVNVDGSQIELDVLDREHGDRHHRRWHPIHGAGWLVAIAGASWEKGGPTERWEGDDGKTFGMRVASMRVGMPHNWTKRGDLRDNVTEEDDNWRHYELDSGELFVFREASYEDLPKAGNGPSPRFAKMKGLAKEAPAMPAPRKAPSAPIPSPPSSGLRWPPPDATREEVAAFYRQHGAA